MRANALALLLLVPAFAGCLGDLNIGGFGRIEPTDILRDDDYSEWLIEIDYVEGHIPSSNAIQLLQTRMEELVNKDEIDIVLDDQLPASGQTWTISKLLDLKRDHQSFDTGGDRVVTWVVYLDGQWESDGTLGVALSDYETVGIFDETIEETASALLSPYSATEIEQAVLVHELGHILGLVNNGIPMQNDRESDEHPGHSTNSNSVMYHAVESQNIIQAFNGGIPTTFDADDKQDICAAGGRC